VSDDRDNEKQYRGQKNSTDGKNSRGPTMACQLEFDSGGASAWMNGAGA
jgi:hypothetical protein